MILSTDGAIDYEVVVVVVVLDVGETNNRAVAEEDGNLFNSKKDVSEDVVVKGKETRLQSRVSLVGWSRGSTTGFNGQISKPMAGSEQR